MRENKKPIDERQLTNGHRLNQQRLFGDFNRAEAKRQRERFLETLTNNGSISTIEARSMGIYHPADIVCKLRKKGYQIKTLKILENGHRQARYRFMTEQEIEAEKKEEGER